MTGGNRSCLAVIAAVLALVCTGCNEEELRRQQAAREAAEQAHQQSVINQAVINARAETRVEMLQKKDQDILNLMREQRRERENVRQHYDDKLAENKAEHDNEIRQLRAEIHELTIGLGDQLVSSYQTGNEAGINIGEEIGGAEGKLAGMQIEREQASRKTFIEGLVQPFGLICFTCVSLSSGLFSYVLVRGYMVSRGRDRDAENTKLLESNRLLSDRVLELECDVVDSYGEQNDG